MESSTSKAPELRTDGFAVTSSWLAVFIMILPVEADLLGALTFHNRVGASATFAAGCFAAVATPFILSLRRRFLQPGVWANRGSLITTGVILAFNILSVSCLFNRLAR